MKLLFVGLAFVAIATASKYLPPQDDTLAVLEEIEKIEPSGVLAQDGYRYKAVKRYRHRRDVNEIAPEYLPPAEEVVVEAPNNQYLAPIESVEPIEELANDGYRYKTVKRLRYRNRRDVSELSSAKYIPPVEQAAGYSYIPPAPVVETIAQAPSPAAVEVAPLAVEAPVEVASPVQDSAVLANDGYRYKTVRRIRYRHRRDVSELPSSEYLPPAEVTVAEPINQYIPPVEISEPIEQIAEDGYRYKTVKRLRHRNRREVNEVASTEYLPPVQTKAGYSYPAPTPVEVVAPAPVAAPVPIPVAAPAPVEVPAPIETVAPVEQSAELASDGYRYKTVRRIRYRVRRDVNELPAEYLPPVQEISIPEPINQYLAPVEAVEPIEQISEDGYRYKTVKRLRHRSRRDVSELSSAKYLPPVQEKTGYSYPAPTIVESTAPAEVEVAAPVETNAAVEFASPVAVAAPVQESVVLANDGYRYKTVRRIRYRNRRDVNELPSNDYLPPVVAAPAPLTAPVKSGYSYPAPAAIEVSAPAKVAAPVEVVSPVPVEIATAEGTQLADDGYRYKTVRRIRYRVRRDVSELPAEYLPPVQEIDVPEPSNQYLAPIEAVEPVEQLTADGYRYKTVKRLRLRSRRDVSELPASEYLPPVEKQVESSYVYPAPVPLAISPPVVEEVPAAIAAPIEAVPAAVALSEVPISVEPTVELASDGYRYKTVKRIRYRQRRDVSELVGSEYLPPIQESAIVEPSNEYLAPVVAIQEPVEQIAADGYRYKTVKKYKIKRN